MLPGMTGKAQPPKHAKYGPNTALLLALTGLMVLYPAIDQSTHSEWVAFVFSTLILICAYSVLAHKQKRTLALVLILGIPMLALGWLPFWQNETLHILGALANLAFYFFITYHVIKSVLTAPVVTPDIVAGAIAIYMLLGILWSGIYLGIYTFSPESFYVGNPDAAGANLDRADLLYFSFITLSTLGYGDITPVSGIARSMAALEAMIGVVYMAVFVGRIVSLRKPMETDA